ncbi:testis-specific serine/threonine-protein kinase 4 isoform X3 [Octodon degus]|uniref:non-specific serine/threonine protein kinase n=1 Tax=Octodon degus TaxID=10160 RepID=A0A6P6DUS7_OCTDE|nr:testis-specific serine/threonine-protein kinase 4 isoform X3 [Octodon degus]
MRVAARPHACLQGRCGSDDLKPGRGLREVRAARPVGAPGAACVVEPVRTRCWLLRRTLKCGSCPEEPLIPGPSLPGLTVSFLSLITNLSATGRDLKLENLLLDKQENVKISDFGFSKMVSSNKTGHSSPSYQRSSIFSQVSQTYCGSFAYSCPEILRGLPYNPFLSDTWSMGVILYTLMVAHLPFDDTNLKKLLRGTQKEVTFPPNHAISQECKSLILQMLCQAAKRATILDIIKDPWVLRFQAEPPTHEIKLLEVMFQPPNTTNAQPLE